MKEEMLEEYKTLREETLKCIEFRYQIFNLTLIVAGTLLSVGISQNGARLVLLLYPILAFFFANAFVYNSMLLIEIGAYIRDDMEKRRELSGLKWATHFRGRYGGIELFELISTYGLFLGTQGISILLFFNFSPSPLTNLAWILLILSIAFAFFTFIILLYSPIYHRGVLSRSRGKP